MIGVAKKKLEKNEDYAKKEKVSWGGRWKKKAPCNGSRAEIEVW
jgi:hypothetical protein